MRYALADIATSEGEEPIWLCTLTLPDGRVYRSASTAITVNVRNPGYETVLQFEPTLSGVDDFEEELDCFGLEGATALTQARVEVVTSDNLASLQGDWQHVTAAACELSTIWDGQSWEDRLVLLSGGTVQGVEWGLAGEPTSFSLESTPASSSANVGDDTRDLGTEWPAPLTDDALAEMSDLAGAKHIWVFGNPDSIPAYKIGEVVVGDNRLILCGHPIPNLGGVTVYEDGVLVGSATPAVTNVGGVDYTYVDHTSRYRAANGAYTWKATNGGIAAANGSTFAALGADGVLRKLLSMSGLRVDWRRMEPTLQQLRGWRVGFFVDEQAPAIDIIRDSLLPYLPIVEMNGGDGLWFWYSDPHTAPIEASLILGQGLVGRTASMESSDTESIRNGFTIRYQKEECSGEYLSTLSLGTQTSALCYYSQQLYGVREDDVLDCPICWDSTTAIRILVNRASRLCLPRRIVSYQLAPEFYWLSAGMCVLVTDPGYGIASHRGVISSVRRTGSPEVRIDLVDRTPTGRD